MSWSNWPRWLKFSLVFFILALVLSIYSSFIIFNNKANFYVVGQEPAVNINSLLSSIPGISLLVIFAYGGFLGLIIGSIILSLLYGLVGAIIGLIYGKIKDKSSA